MDPEHQQAYTSCVRLMARQGLSHFSRRISAYCTIRKFVMSGDGEDGRTRRPSLILEEAHLFARFFLPEDQDPDQPLDSSACINLFQELEEMYSECSWHEVSTRIIQNLAVPWRRKDMEVVLLIVHSIARNFERYSSRQSALNSAFDLIELCVYGGPHYTRVAEWSRLTWFLGMDPEYALEEDAKDALAHPDGIGFVGDINALLRYPPVNLSPEETVWRRIYLTFEYFGIPIS